jgi:dTDP-4-amino-4,6-dideoxygalactose transaminase
MLGLTIQDTVQVPLLDLQPQYASIREDVLLALTRVCNSQRFIMGPEVEELEREVASALGGAHAVAVSSGADALLVSLMALAQQEHFVSSIAGFDA